MQMTANDLLIRLRYAVDLKNREVAEIFAMGGEKVSREDIPKILNKPIYDEAGEMIADEEHIICTPKMFEAFLNGFITFKRGPQQVKPGQKPVKLVATGKENVNNLLLKKVKIALALTTEDIIALFDSVDLNVSKGEIGAFLRKDDHRNYKVCGDNFARNFVKALTLKYRDVAE